MSQNISKGMLYKKVKDVNGNITEVPFLTKTTADLVIANDGIDVQTKLDNIGEVTSFDFDATDDILPDGYTRVESIESTGQQYIDINYIPNETTSISFELAITDTTVVGDLGCDFWSLVTYLDEMNGMEIQLATNEMISIPADTLYHKFYMSAHNIMIDNISKNVTNYFQVDYEYYPFGYVSNSVDDVSYGIYAKLRYLTIMENSNVVRNLVPCYRNIDTKAGLYDLQNDIFYPSETTTNFLYNELSPLNKLAQDVNINTYKINNIKTHIVFDTYDEYKTAYNNGEIAEGLTCIIKDS